MSSESIESKTTGNSGKRFGAGVRFMNEPKTFSGDVSNVNVAINWLKKMSRLKSTCKLTDEEILFVVGDHVSDKAETWWNVVGSKAKTWVDFEKLFKKHYMVNQEDKWWQDLQKVKQGEEYPAIDDVSLKLQELFLLLNNESESFQVRTFLNAIKPQIAYEVERDATPGTFDAAVDKAKQIEKSLNKYGMVGAVSAANNVQDVSKASETLGVTEEKNFSSKVSEASAVSSMFSLVDKLEKLSINLVKLNETNKGGQSVGASNYVSGQQGSGNGQRRQFTCFYCNQPGHKKYDCPKWIQDNVATGSNAIPINGSSGNGGSNGNQEQSGKAQEYQS